MRDFIRKALTKLDRLDSRQIHTLIHNLAQENELYESLMDASLEYMIFTDLEHRIVMYSRNVEKFLLVSRFRELYRRKVWNVIADKELAAFVKNTLESREHAASKDFTLHADGQERIMNLAMIPLASRGIVHGDVFYMTDVTHLRAQEIRLRRAESLASMTTMAASVAHEVKNPLGAMSIHIQLVKKALEGNNLSKMKSMIKNLDVVSEEIEHLNKILVDFLFAVRPMNIKPEKTDLYGLLREIIDFTAPELSAAGVKTEEKLTRRLPRVFIDPKAIRQAVLNIIQNAITAMPQGGKLTITTGIKNNSARIIIGDTGIGIPAADHDKIFEPFFTTRDTGYGLGLTNVLKIVKAHKGDISVDSEPGKGAKFTISLPVPESETQLLEYAKEIL